jgi:hypothetical protein
MIQAAYIAAQRKKFRQTLELLRVRNTNKYFSCSEIGQTAKTAAHTGKPGTQHLLRNKNPGSNYTCWKTGIQAAERNRGCQYS